MRFLIDAQLPPDLAKFLTDQGHEADHVVRYGLLAASDTQIWDFAVELGAIIVTKDRDFADMTNFRTGPQILWLHFSNTRKAELRRRLAPSLPQIVAALQRGDPLVEVT